MTAVPPPTSRASIAAPADPYAAIAAPADPYAAAPYATAEAAPADPYGTNLEVPADPYGVTDAVADADRATPYDTSDLDPGIAAFVEAVNAVPAQEPVSAPKKASRSIKATPIIAALRRAEVDAALGDFGALAASFRASFTPTGLRIDAVSPGSLLARAGFAVGDVITVVDGRPLRTLDDAADIYARAWTTSSSTVQVVRAKQPLTMRIAIQ